MGLKMSSDDAIRSIWRKMIGRCHDKQSGGFHKYGARGITVCLGWQKSCDKFTADIGSRPSGNHTVDRIDGTLGYWCGSCDDCVSCGVTKSNCRWATTAEQARNKRTNVLYTLNGITMCAADWGTKLGMSRWSVARRVRSGWSVELALTKPPPPKRKRYVHKVRSARDGSANTKAVSP